MATIINGDGIVTAEGTSTTQGRLRLGEDTDNGTNYVELQAPASVASNLTFTLPSADGTSGQVLQTNGSGTLSFSTPAAGAWTFIANQAITTGTAIYNFTGLGDYDVIRVLVTNTAGSSNGASAAVYFGLSTGTSAQNPRDDGYYTVAVRYGDGLTYGASVESSNDVAIKGYAGADVGKPFHLDTTIQNFGQSAYTTYIFSANHSQSTPYGSNGSGYVNYSEPYDYVRVSIGQPTTGGNIIVLGAKQ